MRESRMPSQASRYQTCFHCSGKRKRWLNRATVIRQRFAGSCRLLKFIRQRLLANELQPFPFDHHIVVESTIPFIRTRINLQQTAVRMKLHALHFLASMLFQPLEWKFDESKPFIDFTADRVDNYESVAICSAPP